MHQDESTNIWLGDRISLLVIIVGTAVWIFTFKAFGPDWTNNGPAGAIFAVFNVLSATWGFNITSVRPKNKVGFSVDTYVLAWIISTVIGLGLAILLYGF